MLHTHILSQYTLGVLKRLQQLPELSPLRLVGGTVFALQLGHRQSVDLDFFGNFEITRQITLCKKIAIITLFERNET
jgi:hypothetical protein